MGSTTLDPGESLSLGRAYDEVLAAEDLAFSYRLATQSGLVNGIVSYDDTPPPPLDGDYNNNGVVDAADYSVWRDRLGTSAVLPNDATPGAVDSGRLPDLEVELRRDRRGERRRILERSVCSGTVAALILLVFAAGIAFGKRWRLLAIPALACVVCVSSDSAWAQAPPAAYLQTPAPRQLAWHQQEYYAFLHFGHNTFTNEEWGWSQSTPDVFNPTNLDTDQWAQTFVDAGMTGMILTAKHHDGMALWDTATTNYKIANGTWAQNRVAQGLDANVVRMAAESAKSHGLKFGIYLSPWDMHRDPAVPKTNLAGTIYDEPQIFGDSTPGDYNDMYAAQLTELVTMHLSDGSPIEISEVWLDGASGSSTVQTFDWNRFRDIIRNNQPNAVMWGHQGVDARWVGNEDGFTVATNWHTISRTQDQTRYSGSELQTGVRDGLYWTPAESDARLRSGWFYHDNEDPKSAAALKQMYLQTVGRSVNLLLDVPPNQEGKIVQEDVERAPGLQAGARRALGPRARDARAGDHRQQRAWQQQRAVRPGKHHRRRLQHLLDDERRPDDRLVRNRFGRDPRRGWFHRPGAHRLGAADRRLRDRRLGERCVSDRRQRHLAGLQADRHARLLPSRRPAFDSASRKPTRCR